LLLFDCYGYVYGCWVTRLVLRLFGYVYGCCCWLVVGCCLLVAFTVYVLLGYVVTLRWVGCCLRCCLRLLLLLRFVLLLLRLRWLLGSLLFVVTFTLVGWVTLYTVVHLHGCLRLLRLRLRWLGCTFTRLYVDWLFVTFDYVGLLLVYVFYVWLFDLPVGCCSVTLVVGWLLFTVYVCVYVTVVTFAFVYVRCTVYTFTFGLRLLRLGLVVFVVIILFGWVVTFGYTFYVWFTVTLVRLTFGLRLPVTHTTFTLVYVYGWVTLRLFCTVTRLPFTVCLVTRTLRLVGLLVYPVTVTFGWLFTLRWLRCWFTVWFWLRLPHVYTLRLRLRWFTHVGWLLHTLRLLVTLRLLRFTTFTRLVLHVYVYVYGWLVTVYVYVWLRLRLLVTFTRWLVVYVVVTFPVTLFYTRLLRTFTVGLRLRLLRLRLVWLVCYVARCPFTLLGYVTVVVLLVVARLRYVCWFVTVVWLRLRYGYVVVTFYVVRFVTFTLFTFTFTLRLRCTFTFGLFTFGCLLPVGCYTLVVVTVVLRVPFTRVTLLPVVVVVVVTFVTLHVWLLVGWLVGCCYGCCLRFDAGYVYVVDGCLVTVVVVVLIYGCWLRLVLLFTPFTLFCYFYTFAFTLLRLRLLFVLLRLRLLGYVVTFTLVVVTFTFAFCYGCLRLRLRLVWLVAVTLLRLRYVLRLRLRLHVVCVSC